MTERVTVAVLEARNGVIALCSRLKGTGTFEMVSTAEWDPRSFLEDPTGQRLLDEVGRRVQAFWREKEIDSTPLSITMPGTIETPRTIRSSSRLGVRKSIDVVAALASKLDSDVSCHHDLDCMAVGEYGLLADSKQSSEMPQSLSYVFADEGVGSKLIVEGVPYRGAGAAGILGRLIVQPDGAYSPALQSHGPLEVYSSRPWVSQNLLAYYASERQKTGFREPETAAAHRFRRALESVRKSKDWTTLNYANIKDGLDAEDPIAIQVLDTAARFLGQALNAIVTVAHPHVIVLGGGMFTKLDGFAEQVIREARRLCWPLAWNDIEISVSESSRNVQVVGACILSVQK